MLKPRLLIASDLQRPILVRHARRLIRGTVTELSPSLQYFEISCKTPAGQPRTLWVENTLETICEFLDAPTTRSNAFDT
jgi:hypothetical protein